MGDKIEVWVADDTSFPAGDCRGAEHRDHPGPGRPADQPVRRQHVPQGDRDLQHPAGPRRHRTARCPESTRRGDGDKTVALIDNVRDDNYYDFPAASTYIAGFFSSQFNELLDRNVMTIDAYDWAHRTGDNPPDASTADPCTSRPARPNLYEGTFAHEWQHLLHYYTDPFEVNWINEGLSDFAQTLVGYVDATKTVDQPGADSHIYCFQGFGTVQTQYNPNPRDCGGAQNSLTLWGEDPNPAAILADYGNAYSMMLYLYDRFGTEFMSALHRDGEFQGVASLAHELAGRGHQQPVQGHPPVPVDGAARQDRRRRQALDRARRRQARVTTPSLRSTVNLDNPESYDTPGAAPNGADYVASEVPTARH